MKISLKSVLVIAVIGIAFASCRAQSDIDDLFRPKMPNQIDTIYYPFYNGVQMIEVDHLAYWDRKIFYLEQSQPRAMSYSMLEPPPPPNEYFFRDSTGTIIKVFNTAASCENLTAYFANIPLNKKSNNQIHNFFPTHAGKVAFSEGVWPYSPQPQNYFFGFYKVYDFTKTDTIKNKEAFYFGNESMYSRCPVGLIDSFGNIKIPLEYQAIYPLKNNLLVQKNGLWGVIDKEQNEIIELKYDNFKYESTNLITFYKNEKIRKHYKIDKAVVVDLKGYDEIVNPEYLNQYPATMVKLDNKIGFIDSSYNEIVPPIYDLCESFYACDMKLARVLRNNRWGYLNKYGTEVIPCIYEDAETFGRDGIAFVQLDGKQFCIDTTGKTIENCNKKPSWQMKQNAIVERRSLYGLVDSKGIVIVPLAYSQIYKAQNESFYRVYQNKKLGIMSDSGQILLPIEYEYISQFWKEMNIATVTRNEKSGVVDNNFKVIVPCNYESIQFDLTGFLVFKKDGLWGMMDTAMNIKIPAKYQQFNGFRQIMYRVDPNPYSMVMRDSLYGYIDKNGREAIPCRFKQLGYEIHYNRVWFKEREKYGFVDTTGKVVIPAIYDRVFDFGSEATAVQKGDKWALIDKKGKLITDFIYDMIVGHTWYDGQYIVVYCKDKCGVIDNKGKEILPCEYEAIHDFSQATGLKPQFRVTKNGSTYWESTK